MVIRDQSLIANEFVNYYTSLLGTEKGAININVEILQSGLTIPDEDKMELIRIVTKNEIKAALFDIGNDKAPGPDGYSSAFFKNQWDLVGRDMVAAVKEFFTTGRLVKRANTKIVSLIPKTQSNPTVGDYRPISCCNVIYKVITKILSNRIAPFLEKLVAPSQSTFIG